MPYIATVNTTGYLPDTAEQAPVFATAREAWEYHAAERERLDEAWEPMDPFDPDGPQQIDATQVAIQESARLDRTASIYTPDASLVFNVDYIADEDV